MYEMLVFVTFCVICAVLNIVSSYYVTQCITYNCDSMIYLCVCNSSLPVHLLAQLCHCTSDIHTLMRVYVL